VELDEKAEPNDHREVEEHASPQIHNHLRKTKER